jgi:hypothetical protein
LTASVEGSPRLADGVWPRGSGRISGCVRKSRMVFEKSWTRSRSPRPEIRARGEKSVAEEKFSPRLSSRNVRSLRKDLHGVWKDCRGERLARRKRLSLRIMEVGGRRTGIKASRPLDVDTSLLSSLSDCLKDSCILVTSFLFYSISSGSSILSLDLFSHSISSPHLHVSDTLSHL